MISIALSKAPILAIMIDSDVRDGNAVLQYTMATAMTTGSAKRLFSFFKDHRYAVQHDLLRKRNVG